MKKTALRRHFAQTLPKMLPFCLAASLAPSTAMASCNPDFAYLGQVCMMGVASFCPSNTLPADGRLLQIAEYDALYSLLGATYGGDGMANFALPNLSSRSPVGVGTGNGLQSVALGQTLGTETQTIYTQNMPAHSHAVSQTLAANTTPGTDAAPSAGKNALAGIAVQELTGAGVVAAQRWAAPEGDSAKTTAVAGLSSTLSPTSGGSQPFDIRPPSLGLRYCVVVQGIYPSQP